MRATTLLLASVTDVEEARLALTGGADVLDVKDPRRGPLGACAPETLRAIVAVRDAATSRTPVSAALGDIADPGDIVARAAEAAACGADFLKVGLRGPRDPSDAAAVLRGVVGAVEAASRRRETTPGPGGSRVRVVAAAYADAAEIGSLLPDRLPEAAERGGADGCLIDTALKDGRTLLDHLAPEALRRLVSDCHRRGLLCALSGSLRADQVAEVAALGPDLIGARGALCAGGRQGRLDPLRLRAFRRALRMAKPVGAAGAVEAARGVEAAGAVEVLGTRRA